MSSEDRQPLLNNIQTWDSLLRKTGERLRYIEGASAARVPSGLSRLLETIVQQLELGDGILLREQWSYNYSVDVSPLEGDYYQRLSAMLTDQQLESIFGPGPQQRTYAIGFPAIERDNTLLHCAIGHEIGHIPVEHWLVEHFDGNQEVAAEARKAAEESLQDLIEKEETAGQVTIQVRQEVMNMTQRVHKARRRFVEEHGSDIFAIELFGPAALLALANIAMSHGLDSQPGAHNNYYPSWRSRLRFALDWVRRETEDPWLTAQARNNRWGAALGEHLDTLDAFLGRAHRCSNPEMIAADHLAKQTLQALGPELVGKVRTPRGDAMTQAFALANRLDTLTPPNDIGDDQQSPIPPYLSAIFNAGWLHTICDNKHMNSPLDGGEDREVINRLLLKALGDVIIMRSYRAFRDGEQAQ